MFTGRLFHGLIVGGTKEKCYVVRLEYGGLKHCECPLVDV